MDLTHIATVGDLKRHLDYFDDGDLILAKDYLEAFWYMTHANKVKPFGNGGEYVVFHFAYMKVDKESGEPQLTTNEVEDVEMIEETKES